MKTRILLTTIGAAALAVITFKVNASPLLSPRDAGNQVKVVPGITVAQSANTAQTVSPRALGNQIASVATVADDVNPTMACRNMIASPKAISACADNPTAMAGCCKPGPAVTSAR